MDVVAETKRSKYLAKDDVSEGLVATIDTVRKQNVSPEGEKPEDRVVVFFKNDTKPLILNSTNAQLIAKLLGSSNSNDWIGKEVELFHDPNVSFGGKLIGGIRVRNAGNIPF